MLISELRGRARHRDHFARCAAILAVAAMIVGAAHAAPDERVLKLAQQEREPLRATLKDSVAVEFSFTRPRGSSWTSHAARRAESIGSSKVILITAA